MHTSIYLLLLAALCAQLMAADTTGRIQIEDRYWHFQGEQVLLIGAWNHGHNPFIDHTTLDDSDDILVSTPQQITDHLQELADSGGNLLRCVLDPGIGASRGFDAFERVGGQFDLTKPGGPYWDRLDAFLNEAAARNIVVQIEIWDTFDWFDNFAGWSAGPWNPTNNINYTTATSGLTTSYTLSGTSSHNNQPMGKGVPGHPDYDSASAARRTQYDLVRGYQELFVDHLLSITFKYDHVLYCMNNEWKGHQAWGVYWINYIKAKAATANKAVLCTDMFQGVHTPQSDEEFNYQLTHPEIYDYIDVSQATALDDHQTNYNEMDWIANQAEDRDYLMHMTKIYGSHWNGSSSWQGDLNNAREEFWHSLIAGVAGLRFHRPESGEGLSVAAKACIAAARKVEARIRWWTVSRRQDLLSNRSSNEAYLAAEPGQSYVLYMTQEGGGSVGLDLSGHPNRFEAHWINSNTGEWGPRETIDGGSVVTINRPNASAHWVCTMVSAGPLSTGGPTDPYLGLDGTQITAGGVTMSYRSFIPNVTPGETVPLIVYLHSNGRQGTNNTSQVDWRVTRYVEPVWQANHPAALLAPQVPSGRWVDTDWGDGSYDLDAITITPAMSMTIDLIETMLADHPHIDPDRVYVLGTSMGGFAVWNIMMHRPDLFAAAVPVQGGADLSRAPSMAHIPVWSWHGDADPVIPVAASREIMAAMNTAATAAGYDQNHLRYTELPGYDHGGVANEAFVPSTDDWFLAFRRGDIDSTDNLAPMITNIAGMVATAHSADLTASATDPDDGDTALLTYTWTVTAKPAGAADPSYTNNGTHAAMSTTATFTRAGSYTFELTVSDGKGGQGQAATTVIVPQEAVSITVD